MSCSTDSQRALSNKALDQSRDLVWENGGVDSSRPGQRGRSTNENDTHRPFRLQAVPSPVSQAKEHL